MRDADEDALGRELPLRRRGRKMLIRDDRGFTERNSPIYQKDSDFEVFIDADYSCHQYKEFEVNPNNVVWNLMLTQPYADGGEECSGRVATPKENDRYYEVAKQRSATRLLSGAIGDPNGATWAVEVAFAHSDTLARCAFPSRAIQPTVGNRWRVNFSRVERCGEINWTWAPQIIWEPRSKCRRPGKVNSASPRRWWRRSSTYRAMSRGVVGRLFDAR